MDELEKMVRDVQSSAEQVNDIDIILEILDVLDDRKRATYVTYTTEICK